MHSSFLHAAVNSSSQRKVHLVTSLLPMAESVSRRGGMEGEYRVTHLVGYTQLPLIRDSVDLRLVCPKIVSKIQLVLSQNCPQNFLA